jgi:2-methylcitrate dehydratase PrpD
LPGKNVDITDWVLEAMGGLAGYAGAKLLGARLRNNQHSKKKVGHAWKTNAGLTAAQDANQPAAVRDSDHA